MKRTYEVCVPIAGHAYLILEAGSEEEAIAIAMDEARPEHIEEWVTLNPDKQGNTPPLPRPWKIRLLPITDTPGARARAGRLKRSTEQGDG